MFELIISKHSQFSMSILLTQSYSARPDRFSKLPPLPKSNGIIEESKKRKNTASRKETMKMKDVDKKAARLKWDWLGHICCMDSEHQRLPYEGNQRIDGVNITVWAGSK